MSDVNFIEVDGEKFVDDGTGQAKLDENGNPVPFVEEQKTVPYHRFKEMVDKTHDLAKEIEVLKSQKASDKGITPEQEKELQAKQYLKGLLQETLTEQETARKDKESKEAKEFERQVDLTLENNTDVKRSDFVKFLETKADSYGVTSVEGAMRLFKDLQLTLKEAADKAKKDLASKPGLPKHEGDGSKTNYAETDRGKPLWQIAEEAKRELKS